MVVVVVVGCTYAHWVQVWRLAPPSCPCRCFARAASEPVWYLQWVHARTTFGVWTSAFLCFSIVDTTDVLKSHLSHDSSSSGCFFMLCTRRAVGSLQR
jgi:hypothetical protein